MGVMIAIIVVWPTASVVIGNTAPPFLHFQNICTHHSLNLSLLVVEFQPFGIDTVPEVNPYVLQNHYVCDL